MKKILITIAIIIAFILIVFAVNEFEIFGVQFWGVRKQDARREVFENTQSYIEGKRQELLKYHHEWQNADDDGKKAIENTVRISFANFDENKITEPELYSFLKKCKYN